MVLKLLNAQASIESSSEIDVLNETVAEISGNGACTGLRLSSVSLPTVTTFPEPPALGPPPHNQLT
jgi:hypothetical protein